MRSRSRLLQYLVLIVLLANIGSALTADPGAWTGTEGTQRYCGGLTITPNYDLNIDTAVSTSWNYIYIIDTVTGLEYSGGETVDHQITAGRSYYIIAHNNGGSTTPKWIQSYAGGSGQYLNITSGGRVCGSSFSNAATGGTNSGDMREIDYFTYTVIGLNFVDPTQNNNTIFDGNLTINASYTGAFYNVSSIALYNSSDQSTLIHQVNFTGEKYSSFEFNETYINETKYGNTYYVNVTHTDQYGDTYSITREFRYRVLQMFVYDEQTNELIDDRNVSIEVINLDNESTNYTTITGAIEAPDLIAGSYKLNYYADGYALRNYYFSLTENSEITSIDLYLLNDTVGTYKTITVEDESAAGVFNATIKLLREYIDCSCYKTVEMTKTDDSGKSFLFVQEYDGTYKLIIEYDGETKKTSESLRFDTRDIFTTINIIGTNIDSFYDVIAGASGQVDFDTSLNLFSFTYNDVSNANIQEGRLIVTRQTQFQDTTICDERISLSSSVLTCNISSLENATGIFIAEGFVNTSDGLQHAMDVQEYKYGSDYLTFGMQGLFYSLLMIITMSLLGAATPVGGIVGVIIGFMIVIKMGMFYMQISWFVGACIVAAIYIAKMRK